MPDRHAIKKTKRASACRQAASERVAHRLSDGGVVICHAKGVQSPLQQTLHQSQAKPMPAPAADADGVTAA